MIPTHSGAIDYLKFKGVFPKTIECCNCHKTLHLSNDQFRCRQCNKQQSITKGTIFENCSIPYDMVLLIAYHWLLKTPTTSIISITGLSSKTVCKYICKFEKIVSCMVENQNEKIGGEGIIVELDESKFGKRKYNKGHHVEGVWVVGGVERTNERKIFALSVTTRDKDILKSIISDHVLPGSIIYTDAWKAYVPAIEELNANENMNFKHGIVNHKKEFKSEDGVCTNTIEGNWNGLKCNLTSQHMKPKVIDRKLLASIWRRQNKKQLWEAFILALIEIKFE